MSKPVLCCGPALLIGNDDYEMPLRCLNCCAQDAGRMKDKLIELGWHPESIQLLLNTTGENLNHSIVDFVRSAGETISTEHVVIFFYYAGHAREANRTLELMPVDASQPLSVERQLVRELNHTQLTGDRKLVSILCFDACREDTVNLTWRCLDGLSTEGSQFGMRGLDGIRNRLFASNNDFLFLWACDPGRVAGESAEKGGGCFTDELVRSLGPSDAQEDFLTIYTRVQNAVATRTCNRQRPRLDSRLTLPLILHPTCLVHVAIQSACDHKPLRPLPVDVEQLLCELDLLVYGRVLIENEVDMQALRLAAQGSLSDVQALGFPVGPAIKVRAHFCTSTSDAHKMRVNQRCCLSLLIIAIAWALCRNGFMGTLPSTTSTSTPQVVDTCTGIQPLTWFIVAAPDGLNCRSSIGKKDWKRCSRTLLPGVGGAQR